MECSPFSCFTKTRPKIIQATNPSNSNTRSSTKSTTVETCTLDSRSIEKQMKLAEQRQQKTVRILLLGPGSTGKTTILKQIKKIHADDVEEEVDTRNKMAKYVKSSVIDYMKILCVQSVELNTKYNEDTLVDTDNEYLREEILSLQTPCELTEDIVVKMKMLWADKGIQQTLTMRKYFQIHENVAYFFNRMDVIAEASYKPTFDDYLRFRQKSTGLHQTTMDINMENMGTYTFEFTDVAGQRSERRKWMNFISEDVHAVIYVVGLSDFDLNMFEDNKTNRLKDSIELFKTVMIKGQFFKKKSVLLFFNKYDLFKEKIKNTPITVAFDDFPNEMDPHGEDDVVRFIAEKFLKVLSDAKVHLFAPLHILRTTALDTNNIEKIFSKISLDLVKENLNTLSLM